ncbi:hypothetical protein O3G_MSEX010147 [Manduca sexta]|uniref:Serpin domain-containing protein n=1 Tax=Manduca sexta TaxID=7130 RepID=A0A921ZGN9_MANSE|nr:hypothetical protein O3G_MSEX010147 [Manduca sexta]
MLVQAPRRWVSSPLGVNILLALCGESSPTISRYIQINKLIKGKKEVTTKNIVYHSPCLKPEHFIRDSNLEINYVKTGKLDVFKHWMQELQMTENIEKQFPTNTKLILRNLSIVKGLWDLSETSAGPLMKIYNSFNYTQDVKYDARILVLPLQNLDFKLVIIVPNEVDVLNNLFEKLNTKGLTAAINSVQPLFTATSELKAPCVNIVSEIGLQCQNTNSIVDKTAAQAGIAKIDNTGVHLEVVTSIYSALSKTTSINEGSKVENPFYFAVTYQDTPIFTGQYSQD